MTLLELAAKCEAATGPDRELDADIWIALNIPTERVGRIDKDAARGVVGWHPLDGPYEGAREVPRYTASLDAAMTLPEAGWRLYMVDASIPARFSVMLKGPPVPTEENGELRNLPQFVTAVGKTLEGALTAAALRARANPEEKPNDLRS